jgi:RNA polymerase sigma factor (sigma-70 family)
MDSTAPRQPNQEDLIAAALLHEKHPDAFILLDNLKSYCRAVLHGDFPSINDEDLADIIGDSIVDVFNKGDLYNPMISSIRTWLVWHGRIKAKAFRKKHRPHLREPLDEHEDRPMNDGHKPVIIDAATMLRAEERLALLTNKQRTVFRMLLKGHSVNDVAKALNITRNAVDVHKTRGLQRLRRSTNE